MKDSSDRPDRQRMPLWMAAIIIACMLPLIAFPTLLGVTPPDSSARTFAWLYPFYVIASGVCAWICWPERKEISWILIILMLLSHAAMWFLATATD